MKPASFFQLAVCLVFCLSVRPGAAQMFVPDTSFWETKAGMNISRCIFPSVQFNGKIYVLGGVISNSGAPMVYTDKIETYDIDADTWTITGSLPSPMGAMAAVELNGAIYIIGGVTGSSGQTSSSKVYRYFPTSGTFDADTIASLPAARAFLSASVVNGKIYAIGGTSAFAGPVYNDVYEYDPVSNEWKIGADLNIGRAFHTSEVVGSKIYVLGGTVTWADGLSSMEVFDVNDPGLGWNISVKSLSHARGAFGSAVLSDVIYALGGRGNLSSLEMTVEAYSPEIANDDWDVFKNLTYDRRMFGCAGWGDIEDDFSYIYIMGGLSGSSVISTTQRLVVKTSGSNEAFSSNSAVALTQIFPNPCNQNTAIAYSVTASSDVVLLVYDRWGRLVARPVDTRQAPGEYQVRLDATDLVPGVYTCVLNTGAASPSVKRMVVLR